MARFVRYVLWLLIVLGAGMGVVMAWRVFRHAPGTLGFLRVEPPPALAAYPGLVLGDFALLWLVFGYGLYRLARLMRLFEQGEYFAVATTAHLRVFSWSLILGVALDWLLPPLEVLAIHLATTGDAGNIMFTVNSTGIWLLLMGALFFVIASILVEARQAADDSRLII